MVILNDGELSFRTQASVLRIKVPCLLKGV